MANVHRFVDCFDEAAEYLNSQAGLFLTFLPELMQTNLCTPAVVPKLVIYPPSFFVVFALFVDGKVFSSMVKSHRRRYQAVTA